MPNFQPRNLSVLAYANGFTLWHYMSSDSASDVAQLGYFNNAAATLRVGDMILANIATTTPSPQAGLFVVKRNDSSGVDVANLTAFGDQNTN
jgi:hypothetical protein